MRMTVSNLSSDQDIDALQADNRKSTRQQMQELGDLLISATNQVLKSLTSFVPEFNRVMEHVTIKVFNFDGADYQLICNREVEEIRTIFNEFSISIKELSC